MSTSLVSKLPPADVIISSSFETLRSTFKVEFADFYSRVCERYDTPSYTPPGRTSPKFLFRLHTRKRNRTNSPYSVELQFYLLSTGKRFSMQYSCSLLAKGEERKYTKGMKVFVVKFDVHISSQRIYFNSKLHQLRRFRVT